MTQETEYHELESMFYGSVPYIMGTRFGLLMFGPSSKKAEDIWKDICLRLEHLDKMLNRFDEGSVLFKLNSLLSEKKEAWIDEEMEKILYICKDYHIKTKGFFDISLDDFSKIEISQRRIRASRCGMSLDFGGLAKGYVLENIKARLLEEGVENAFVDFGGSSILGLGHHPYGDSWKVQLKNPLNGQLLKEFLLRDSALSISGNTRDYNGHILNPHSGVANKKKMLCSVEGLGPLDAEVLSTVVMAAGNLPEDEILKAFGRVDINIFETE